MHSKGKKPKMKCQLTNSIASRESPHCAGRTPSQQPSNSRHLSVLGPRSPPRTHPKPLLLESAASFRTKIVSLKNFKSFSRKVVGCIYRTPCWLQIFNTKNVLYLKTATVLPTSNTSKSFYIFANQTCLTLVSAAREIYMSSLLFLFGMYPSMTCNKIGSWNPWSFRQTFVKKGVSGT